nr:aminoglycoside adenylyltransferase domain-containing protein [Streptomyces sp. FIT100]
MALRGNAPLHGPPPAALFDPGPHEDLRRAIVAGVPELLDDLESDTRNVLLTLARIWMTPATGTIGSKDAAAAVGAPPAPGAAPPRTGPCPGRLRREGAGTPGRAVAACPPVRRPSGRRHRRACRGAPGVSGDAGGATRSGD